MPDNERLYISSCITDDAWVVGVALRDHLLRLLFEGRRLGAWFLLHSLAHLPLLLTLLGTSPPFDGCLSTSSSWYSFSSELSVSPTSLLSLHTRSTSVAKYKGIVFRPALLSMAGRDANCLAVSFDIAIASVTNLKVVFFFSFSHASQTLCCVNSLMYFVRIRHCVHRRRKRLIASFRLMVLG